MELKCRALTKEARRWVYGYYCELKSRQFIIENDADLELLYGEEGEDGPSVEAIYNFIEVDPKTVGLSTGLKTNGKEVWQGDILKRYSMILPVTIDDYHGYRFMIGKDQLCKADIIYGEIIGNIHEHPHLLEQQT